MTGRRDRHIRVLHVTAAAERGGLEVVLLQIVKRLDRSRFTPVVWFLEDGPFVTEAREAGVETHTIRSGRVRDIVRGQRALREAQRLLGSTEIALVHTHNAKAHFYGGRLAAKGEMPCVFHLHGVPAPGLSRDGIVNWLALRTPASRRVACSRYVAEATKRACPTVSDIDVIYNGVSVGATSVNESAIRARAELGVAVGVPLVVMACRLQPGKGVHVFVEAAGRVHARLSDVRFILVGGALFGKDRDYEVALRQQVARAGLSQVFTLTGYRSDALNFIAAADLVVHASVEPDSFPTVLLESMELGRPTVASDLGGAAEIVEHEKTGLLVSANDVEGLAEAIVRLLKDPARRRRMGEAGCKRASQSFRASRMVRDWEAVYEEVIGERARAC